jgi:hypothetical protein
LKSEGARATGRDRSCWLQYDRWFMEGNSQNELDYPFARWLAFVSASPRWFAPTISTVPPRNHPPNHSIGSYLVIRTKTARTWRSSHRSL